MARSARKYGLQFGVYLSPWDRHDPRYKDSAAYDDYYQAELSELASNYGDLVEFWLDGAGSAGHVYNFPKIIETLRTYQPNTIVFADTGLFEYGDARWVGNESGLVSYENWNVIDRHGYLRWRPVEADTPLRKQHWFWHPNDEASVKSLNELLTTYDQTVGHGAQLMLGLAPDRRGLLPDSDVARLEEFGKALRARYQPKPRTRAHANLHRSRLRPRRQPRHLLVCSRRLPSLHTGSQLPQARHLQPRAHHGMAQRRPAQSRNTPSKSGPAMPGRPSRRRKPSVTRRSTSSRRSRPAGYASIFSPAPTPRQIREFQLYNIEAGKEQPGAVSPDSRN